MIQQPSVSTRHLPRAGFNCLARETIHFVPKTGLWYASKWDW